MSCARAPRSLRSGGGRKSGVMMVLSGMRGNAPPMKFHSLARDFLLPPPSDTLSHSLGEKRGEGEEKEKATGRAIVQHGGSSAILAASTVPS